MKYRKLLDPLFAPKKIAALEPVIRKRTDEHIDSSIVAARSCSRSSASRCRRTSS
jgi:cytochrome P450